MKYINLLRILISVILIFSSIYGMIGFLIGYPMLFNNRELPLDNIQGMIIQNNKIYLGLGTYNVIQKYTLNGDFIGYEEVNSNKWGFTFDIDTMGNATIYEKSNVSNQTFDTLEFKRLLGNETFELLKKLDSKKIIGKSTLDSIKVKNAVYYVTKDFFPKIKKLESSKTTILVDQTWLQKSLQGRITPWLISAISIFLLFKINILRITKHIMNGFPFFFKKSIY